MKKDLTIGVTLGAIFVIALVSMMGAGTDINGNRTVEGNLTVKGTCTGCGSGGTTTYGACGSLPGAGAGNNGNTYVSSDSGYNYYGSSAVWNAKWGPYNVTVPPTSGSWSADDLETSTLSTANCFGFFNVVAGSARVRINYVAAAGNFTATAGLNGGPFGNLGYGGGTSYGLYLGDSGAKWIGLTVFSDSNAFTHICLSSWTTSTSASANACTPTYYFSNLFSKDFIFFRAIVSAGTTITWQMSVDNINFKTYGTTTCTTFLAACPTKAGWGQEAGADTQSNLIHWLVQ